jgi:hypothetical protein
MHIWLKHYTRLCLWYVVLSQLTYFYHKVAHCLSKCYQAAMIEQEV